jgi:hypothetical protein
VCSPETSRRLLKELVRAFGGIAWREERGSLHCLIPARWGLYVHNIISAGVSTPECERLINLRALLESGAASLAFQNPGILTQITPEKEGIWWGKIPLPIGGNIKGVDQEWQEIQGDRP